MRSLLLCCCLVVGCEPTADADLFGLWSNLDQGEQLVFEFAANGDELDLTDKYKIYRLYSYGQGDDPRVVQRGGYDVTEQVLVQEVSWCEDNAQIGQSYGNDIYRSTKKKLVLESESMSNGKRVFEAVDSLP